MYPTPHARGELEESSTRQKKHGATQAMGSRPSDVVSGASHGSGVAHLSWKLDVVAAHMARTPDGHTRARHVCSSHVRVTSAVSPAARTPTSLSTTSEMVHVTASTLPPEDSRAFWCAR